MEAPLLGRGVLFWEGEPMKKTLGFALSTSLLLFACGKAEEPPEVVPPAEPLVDEAAAVRAVADSWDPVANAENLDGMMAFHAADAVRLNAGEPAVVGPEAIRADFAADWAGEGALVGSNPVDEVQVAGSWAFARGTFLNRTTAAGTGEVTEARGKWATIYRKTADGWKIHVDSWNRDAPASADASAGAREPADRGELPPVVTTPSNTAEEAVLAAGTAWDAANNAADVDALVAFYTADAIRMSDEQPVIQGADALRKDFETGFSVQTPNGAGVVRGVQVEGDWAYSWGTWTDRPTIKATGKVLEDGGKWLNVWRASPDGWKLYVDLWNRDAPPPSR
jgi:ketosteroid isomerase-like protein